MRRGFGIGTESGNKAWYAFSVCLIDWTTRLQQISFLYGNNWEVLEEITDNEHGDKPIDIRDKADPETEQEITEIKGVTDIPIGSRCNEISRCTERSRPGGCPCIPDRPYPENLTCSDEQHANYYGVPQRFCKVEEREDKRDRCETADFEEEVANIFNFPCGSVK